MRHVILKDKKITTPALKKWQEEDVAFWEKHIGMTPTYEVIETDYTTYPTYVDEDGDIRPTAKYLQSLTDTVTKKVGDYGCDFILMLVHEDNWRSDTDTTKGIWGTSWSYKFGEQHFEYCRWDKDNPANTFGTAYHERMHPMDALVKVETGLNLDTIVEEELRRRYSKNKELISYLDKNGFKWDRDVVHGAMKPTFTYIRWKENTDVLHIAGPYIKQALEKRRAKNDAIISGLEKTLVTLMQEVIRLLRKKLNQKDGVPRT